jgi:short-subunit dehydrogenase
MWAVLPQMVELQGGNILAIGSAYGLCCMTRASTYSAAGGTQLTYIKAMVIEVPLRRFNLMMNNRRTYSPDFKREAASLILDQDYSYSKACESLDLSETVLIDRLLVS